MVQARTRPHSAPRIAGNQRLKLAIEISGCSNSAVYVLIAKNLPAYAKSRLQRVRAFLGRQQEIENRSSERTRTFQVGKMRGWQKSAARAVNAASQKLAVLCPGGGWIALSTNHQGRRCNFFQQIVKLRVAQRGTAT